MDDELKSGGLGIKDYWAVLGRRRWCLLGPLFLLGWAGFLIARVWPYLYRSDALILVEQQKVPEQYVTPNVVSDLQDRLQSMTQQILSRTRLQRLIEQFNLYPRERAHMVMEDVVDRMREDIQIAPVVARGRAGDLTAFRISYSARNARIAQQVVTQLTSLFIEENLQTRTQQSVGTTNFLEGQLETARKDLEQQEKRLREYKMRYLGQLPEEQQSNLQILSSLEEQLHAASDSLSRAQQQKIYLESMRDQQRALQKSLEDAAQADKPQAQDGEPTTVAAAQAALNTLRNQLADDEARYTPQHPDIVRLKGEIERVETLRKRLEAEEALSAKDKANSKRLAKVEPQALIEVESQLKATEVEIQNQQKEVEDLRGRIQDFQSRLSLTPVREQQLAEVTRSYENSRQYYQSLLQKKLQSELATNLEKHQEGEQFRILDPASLPEKPDEPNPLEIILIGWAAGLSVGVALTALRESSDSTLHRDRDISSFTNLPILVRIPTLLTPAEEVRQKWYRGLEAAGVALLTLLSVSVGTYTYLIGSGF